MHRRHRIAADLGEEGLLGDILPPEVDGYRGGVGGRIHAELGCAVARCRQREAREPEAQREKVVGAQHGDRGVGEEQRYGRGRRIRYVDLHGLRQCRGPQRGGCEGEMSSWRQLQWLECRARQRGQ